MTMANSKVTSMVRLLEELSVVNLQPITPYHDNQSVVHIGKTLFSMRGPNTSRLIVILLEIR